MPACPFPALAGLASICCCAVFAQQPEHRAAETSNPEKITLASGVDRISGVEATSNIRYVRLVLSGALRASSSGDSSAPSPGPTLIAQCTMKPNGRSSFDLFANFGGATDLAFYPPWTPA